MRPTPPPPAPPLPPPFAATGGVLAVVLAVLYVFSEAVAPVYPEVRARQALLATQAEAVEVVTLGHSHNRAILYDSLLSESALEAGFHLWRSSRDPFETRWAFEAERPLLPNLRTVLIAVAPYAWDNTAIQPRARDRRRELYRLHPTAGRWTEDLGLRLHALAAPVVRGDHWKGVVYALLGRPLAVDVAANGWIDDRPRTTVRDAATLDSIAVLTAEAHAAVDGLTQQARPGFCAAAAEALAALPAIADEGVRVVFYTPPYWPPYLRRIAAAAPCDLRPVARQLAADASRVVYFDDSAHPGFVREAGLFLDADHLNVWGAGRYAAMLRNRLATGGL